MAIIGIDLGTTHSLAAIWKNNEPVIIPNRHNEELTPSIVGIDNDASILIGETAKDRLITHPDLTTAQFKRYMGTSRVTTLQGKNFLPEELSSLVLRAIKEDAEAYLGEEVTDAVISVPAYFNDTQRQATKTAGKLAGLNVKRLINEPTAAAIAYGLPKAEEELTFLVFDLGGGTFDISILELFENTMEVHASAGDNYLGGEDFTKVLFTSICREFSLDVKSLQSIDKNRLWKYAEEAKRTLTHKTSVTIEVSISTTTGKWTITRDDFERNSAPLLERIKSPIERALRDARLSPSSLDAVILVGGAGRMPMIRSLAAKLFGSVPYTTIDPDKAIALGTAVQAGLLLKENALKEIIMTDVCPYTLGIDVVKEQSAGQFISGQYLPIIERNTTVPVSKVDTVTNIRDDQTSISLAIYQGESRLVRNNIKLGELSVPIKKGKAGTVLVDIRFTYDINGILEVEATVKDTGTVKKIVIEKNPGIMSPEKIEQRFKELAALKIHPRENSSNRALLALGERLYEESKGEVRQFIAEHLSQFESVLESQDPALIQKAYNQTKSVFQSIEEERNLF